MTAGWIEAGPGSVRRPDRRLGRPAGPGPLRPGAGSTRPATRYALVGWPSKRGPRRARRALARPPRRPRLRRQRLERLLPRRGPAPRRRASTRPSAPITRTSTSPSGSAGPATRCVFTPRLPDPPRRLGQLRPRPPRAPAPDVAQRRAPLLDQPAGRLAARRGVCRTWRSPPRRASGGWPAAAPARSCWASSTRSGNGRASPPPRVRADLAHASASPPPLPLAGLHPGRRPQPPPPPRAPQFPESSNLPPEVNRHNPHKLPRVPLASFGHELCVHPRRREPHWLPVGHEPGRSVWGG